MEEKIKSYANIDGHSGRVFGVAFRHWVGVAHVDDPKDGLERWNTSGTETKPKKLILEHENIIWMMEASNHLSLQEATI